MARLIKTFFKKPRSSLIVTLSFPHQSNVITKESQKCGGYTSIHLKIIRSCMNIIGACILFDPFALGIEYNIYPFLNFAQAHTHSTVEKIPCSCCTLYTSTDSTTTHSTHIVPFKICDAGAWGMSCPCNHAHLQNNMETEKKSLMNYTHVYMDKGVKKEWWLYNICT